LDLHHGLGEQEDLPVHHGHLHGLRDHDHRDHHPDLHGLQDHDHHPEHHLDLHHGLQHDQDHHPDLHHHGLWDHEDLWDRPGHPDHLELLELSGHLHLLHLLHGEDQVEEVDIRGANPTYDSILA